MWSETVVNPIGKREGSRFVPHPDFDLLLFKSTPKRHFLCCVRRKKNLPDIPTEIDVVYKYIVRIPEI